ncbi:bifunctional precorrin-2 dehydrogenase/sirohydrochlorin ferrochelatase [uncultured Megamonas sp.]|uniref:precorrin-2 dehydrogenase/sirohydrochlorin ferrochelatase family protein n=1 Tax=uncultured Megamonas sp. TaxID=286140 RepID=UPI00266F581A|nr:bifunctional precorrin-2 dehydrogenase/sirohydrochlorin ferrochelatase [uncultured Megamonas sp.]
MYPINLILDNKPCVVLGGGHVALRKVKGLLDAKAKVTVISPEIVAELAKLVEEKRIIWQKKCYEQGDLDDFTLAICAIGNEKINAEVQREAKQKKVILNVVDRLEFCDFALPAKIRRGDLLVTFSTNGKSPALAKYLRCKMEREFDETYAKWLDRLVQLRKEAIKTLPTSDDREIFWRSALSDDVMELVKNKKYDEAEASIRDAISSFRA